MWSLLKQISVRKIPCLFIPFHFPLLIFLSFLSSGYILPLSIIHYESTCTPSWRRKYASIILSDLMSIMKLDHRLLMVRTLLREEKGGANLKATNATSKSYKSWSPCKGQRLSFDISTLQSRMHLHVSKYRPVKASANNKDIKSER
jgi:hypothetical protein